MPSDSAHRQAVCDYQWQQAGRHHILMGGGWNADASRTHQHQTRQLGRFLTSAAGCACYLVRSARPTHFPENLSCNPSQLDAFIVSDSCRGATHTQSVICPMQVRLTTALYK